MLAIVFVWALGFAFLLGFAQETLRYLSAWVTILLWPVMIPFNKVVDVWRWGFRHRRYHYIDMRWWQRGLKERRETDPNRRWTGED